MLLSLAAFTGKSGAFADTLVRPGPPAFNIEIEVKKMRLIHPSRLLLPLTFILTGTFLVLGQFHLIQTSPYQQLWPVTIIAAGLEELYRWARSGQ